MLYKPFLERMKNPILLRRTLFKTKDFFPKTLKNLKSFLFKGYQKLPRSTSVNLFLSASNSCRKMQELDDFYTGFSKQWPPNLDEKLHEGKKKSIASPEVLVVEEGECIQTTDQNSVENSQINMGNEEEKGSEHHESNSQEACCHGKFGRSRILVNRLKEFEMFDVVDVDHQLDIKEVLHYYSRLTCPVYVNLVDDFFMDMYSEFVLPQPSVSVSSSMRRLGPVKL